MNKKLRLPTLGILCALNEVEDIVDSPMCHPYSESC